MARKVLIFISTLKQGGAERNVAMFCRKMDRTRFLPEVWTLESGGELEEEVRATGIKVHNLGRGWSWDPHFALRAASLLSKSGADLMHVFLPTAAAYAILARLTYRSTPPMLFSQGASTMTRWYWTPLYRYGIGRYFFPIVCNSESVYESMARVGIDAQRLRVIPNGHDTEPYTTPVDREKIRAEFGIKRTDTLLMSVARMIEQKRQCDLVEAFSICCRANSSLRLVLVGDGPLRPDLERQAAELGLGERVVFTGIRRDVPALLRCADLFVYASEMEGLANSVIEACLARLPIVACDAPGVRDVARHRHEAMLAPTRNPMAIGHAIEHMLENPEQAGQLAHNAQKRALSHFLITNTLNKIYMVYNEVLERAAAMKSPRIPASRSD